jgi:DNA-binding IclR family transcriptional regulator
VTPTTIISELGLSKSAAYRLVHTLVELEYLDQTDGTHYRLGVRSALLGAAAIEQADIHRLAPAYLEELVGRVHETAFLAIRDRDSVVYVNKVESEQSIQVSCKVASRRSLHCTALGKSIMAALGPDELEKCIDTLNFERFTEYTITDRESLIDALSQTRGRGYALDVEEAESGVVCVAAAVLDAADRPVAAVSVSGPTGRLLPNQTVLGKEVSRTAARLSQRMGGRALERASLRGA